MKDILNKTCATIMPVLEKMEATISALKSGDRISATDMCKNIATETNVSLALVIPLSKVFLDMCEADGIVERSRGKNGGTTKL